MNRRIAFVAILSLLLIALPVSAQASWGGNSLFGQSNPSPELQQNKVLLTAEFKVKPGTQLGKVYIRATIAMGYHLYSVTHPDSDARSKFDFQESKDFRRVGNWKPNKPPKLKPDPENDWMAEHHYSMVTWSAPVEFSDGVDPETVKVSILYRGLVCDLIGCQPFSENLEAEFAGVDHSDIVKSEITDSEADEKPTGPKPVETEEQLASLAKLYDGNTPIKYEKLDGTSGRGTFWAALFGAFVGGMLLNLMPCVFPVLGLKVLGFVEQAGNDPRKTKLHGLAFAAGLVASMLVLAGIILSIKWLGGQQVNWGEQMGNSYFVGAMVILLFVLGLNLAGVFEMGLFMGRVGGSKKNEGYAGSFASGVLTTLVATPCSGPFLGTAMGYTLAQEPIVALFLFTVFGVGIAFPYVVLSFFPALLKVLPKPGQWMETFKKLMAFTLFAAAAFFIKSFGSQTGIDGLSWLLMALCVIGLAAFFYGQWSPVFVERGKRLAFGIALPAVVVALGLWMYLDAAAMKAPKLAAGQDGWELWVPGRVENLLAEYQKPVFVDFTADW